MLKGFRDFIMRGNVIDLAVAVVIGAAFTAVVNAVVTGLINPVISMFFQADSLNEAMKIPLFGGSELSLGLILGAIINFLVVAAVVYFVFVMPVNHVKQRAEERIRSGQPPAAGDPPTPTEVELLGQIRDLLAEQSGTTQTGGKHADS